MHLQAFRQWLLVDTELPQFLRRTSGQHLVRNQAMQQLA